MPRIPPREFSGADGGDELLVHGDVEASKKEWPSIMGEDEEGDGRDDWQRGDPLRRVIGRKEAQ